MTAPVWYDGGSRLPPVGEGTMCTAAEGKTRQSDAQAADINYLVKKYETTGALPPSQREGYFADVSSFPTFQEALNHVVAAREYFLSLPPDVRAEFGNSEARFLDAWNAGEKPEVFEKIGLIERVPAEPEAAPAAEPQARNADGTFAKG